MIVVIQCAAKKKPEAGHLRLRDGQKVLFVADPESAPAGAAHAYARPDDIADTGVSWRAELLSYNNAPTNNPLGFLPAWQLYENRTYEILADRYGLERLYILSAGWGLIAADFLTPAYDITFSSRADGYKRRRKKDSYKDLRMLLDETVEPVVFLGGKDYVSFFCELTRHVKGQRYLFYNSKKTPVAPGCTPNRFASTNLRKWYYECAQALIEGEIDI